MYDMCILIFSPNTIFFLETFKNPPSSILLTFKKKKKINASCRQDLVYKNGKPNVYIKALEK